MENLLGFLLGLCLPPLLKGVFVLIKSIGIKGGQAGMLEDKQKQKEDYGPIGEMRDYTPIKIRCITCNGHGKYLSDKTEHTCGNCAGKGYRV